MTVPPFEGIWTNELVTRHPLVLAVLARYLRNSTDTSNEKSSAAEFAKWMDGGAQIEHFSEGAKSAGFPVLDLHVVIDTPAGAPAQTRHRDTVIPGPCASLGVHIPLQQLTMEPLNGAIGFTPGSHANFSEDALRRDVVGNVPLGSVLLYDSFTEHHGLENRSDRARPALLSWFRVPGVYTGHASENFGPRGVALTMQFRRLVQERLAKVIAAERERSPGASAAAASWDFSPSRALADWGEVRVCFRCQRTASLSGEDGGAVQALGGARWRCGACAAEAERRQDSAAVAGSQLEDGDCFSERTLQDLAARGMNVRPGGGRHPLTILRERGVFLPIDPEPAWLARVDASSLQPEGWRRNLRVQLGELPKTDNF
eukprot:TRINITY_DN18829_c0_g1_i1.p1 TRINITY_DN18829_c0_g1~~TRINITY_DN18829_c0_g1_i1.p1  ORF type:complete len:393 (-),score=54.79 TRINITY_DN18829_c0_g1_i1:539-1654(-)